MRTRIPLALLAAPLLAVPALAVPVLAVPTGAQSLDLTVNDVGISIGDSRRVTGLRLNFRDRRMEEVNGINLTVWTPREARGEVRGVAAGLPVTGARRIDGLALGILGAGATDRIRGITLAGLGAGSGRAIEGVTIAGLGAGTGEDITGLTVAALGAGPGSTCAA